MELQLLGWNLNDVGSQLSVSATAITGNSAVRAGGGIEDNSGTSTIILTDVNLNNNSVSGPQETVADCILQEQEMLLFLVEL